MKSQNIFLRWHSSNEKDIKLFGYKLCDYQFSKNYFIESSGTIESKLIKRIKEKCEQLIKDDCRELYIDSHQYTDGQTQDNSTIINIIPKYSINMNYQEQLKINYYDLFYEGIGIVEMWIGWSVASITSLTSSFIRKMEFSSLFK